MNTIDQQLTVLRPGELQDGDVVLLETSQPISAEGAAMLKERICELMPFLRVEDVVVLGGIHLQVVRPPR